MLPPFKPGGGGVWPPLSSPPAAGNKAGGLPPFVPRRRRTGGNFEGEGSDGEHEGRPERRPKGPTLEDKPSLMPGILPSKSLRVREEEAEDLLAGLQHKRGSAPGGEGSPGGDSRSSVGGGEGRVRMSAPASPTRRWPGITGVFEDADDEGIQVGHCT